MNNFLCIFTYAAKNNKSLPWWHELQTASASLILTISLNKREIKTPSKPQKSS